MPTSLAPFVPSQEPVVQKMLEMAQVNADDVVFDLGCGDGRILVTAVKEFGAKKAVGYEMRADLYKRIMATVEKEALMDKIHVVNGDLLKADLSEATVITLYLTTSGNSKLKPKFAKEAKRNTRIVSHDFRIEGWSYVKKEDFRGHTIYLYHLPASLARPKSRSPFSFRR